MSKSPFLFGVIKAHLTPGEVELCQEAAAAENAEFHQLETQCWFATQHEGLGDPFDRDLARRVYARLTEMGFPYWSNMR